MLLTKIHIPVPRENVIPRSRLFEKLDMGLNHKLILVSAPAGYGKTTLVCDWIRVCGIPTAWYSIDHRDNDPFEFLTFLISCIQTIHKEVGRQSLELLKSQGTVSNEYIIELLINDLLTLEDDFLLVMDDLHSIGSNEIFAMMRKLIEHSPRNFNVAILTRADPPVNLSRLRSQNELLEIRSSDLNFSINDISELFNRKLKLGLNDDDIHIIESKTEGWIAGLQLAAISLQGNTNSSAFIEGIAGYNRFIMDYLMEEVLNKQSKEIKDFLLNTSVLDKLSGSLCNAVLQRENSQFILESLEKSNMFIVPLDNDRKWFRYHHLFRDLLQQRMMLSDENRVPSFHHRACNWHEENGMLEMAVEHALKAGNTKKGFALIDEIIDKLVETSQYPVVLRYAELFSDEDISSNIKFGVLYAWSLTITGRLKEADKLLAELESKIAPDGYSGENKGLLGTMHTTYALLNDFMGRADSSLKYAELAIKYIPEDDFIWNSWAYYCKAGPHLLRFELDESIASLTTGLEYATKTNNAYLEIVHNKLAFLLKLKGRYSEALKYCNTMLKNSTHYPNNDGFRVNLFSSVLYSTMGSITVEQGNTKEGIEMALRGFELSQKLVSISFRGYSRYLLAEAYYKAGAFEEALDITEKHDANLKSITGHWLSVLSNALKLKLLSRLGEKEEAEILFKKLTDQANNHQFAEYLYGVSGAHYFISSGLYSEANALVEDLSSSKKNKEVLELFAEVELMKVKIYLQTGRRNDAIECITDLLTRTQAEGFLRLYVNEGEDIAGLIKELLKEKMVSRQYISKLNTAFEMERKRKIAQSDGDLSSRETEILQLISQRLSNKDICDALYISLSTVKTHISNILLKLEAKNRQEATEIAREKGLI